MKYLLILAIIGLVFVSGCIQPTACTEDARMCPDGSTVVREGPDCEFAACPTEELPKAPENMVNPMIAGIFIEDFEFSPATLTIDAGTPVFWMNEDSVLHNIMNDADDVEMGELFDLNIEAGERGSFTFTEAGTYNYHCHIHPSMKGTVIVK